MKCACADYFRVIIDLGKTLGYFRVIIAGYYIIKLGAPTIFLGLFLSLHLLRVMARVLANGEGGRLFKYGEETA